MTSCFAAPAAKLGALLLGVLTLDLRSPVQVLPSAAVLEARARAAARREQTLVAAQDCPRGPVENGTSVTVAFALHSADLTEAGRAALDAAAARLVCAPKLTAMILSQGDAHRLAGYRREVADRRAEMIAAYFRGDGVFGDRVERAPPEGAPLVSGGVLLVEAVGPDA
jgi:hypothetical protein